VTTCNFQRDFQEVVRWRTPLGIEERSFPASSEKELSEVYVNLTSIDLYNWSGPTILGRRTTSEVLIRWGYIRNFTVRGLMLT